MYDVIYADPPWLYSNKTFKTLNPPYPMLTLDELKQVKIPSNRNSVLFMWVTSPILPWALEVIGSWGFKYKQIIVWDKMTVLPGYHLQNRVEILFYCIKGKITPVRCKRPNILQLKGRRKHSSKPHEFYELIEEMFPDAKKLELFARNERSGWDQFGNEIQNSVTL